MPRRRPRNDTQVIARSVRFVETVPSIVAAGLGNLSEAAGFVAVVAHNRNASIETDLDGLAAEYERLRGPSDRVGASAGPWAAVVAFNAPQGQQANAEVRAPAWAVAAGAVHFSRRPPRAGVDDLEGQFALLAYDDAHATLILASDPFGMHGVYVAERNGKTYVSTSVLALARYLRATPSLLGVHSFLRAGYHFGRRTSWEGIERLDPATCLAFTPEGVETQVYWAPAVDAPVARLDFEEVVAHCTEVAVGAYRDLFTPTPPVWVDLTGGYDTRLLVLALRAAEVAFDTNTRETRYAADISVAREIARRAGWNWSLLSLPDDWESSLQSMLPVALAWGDGNLDAIQLARVLWAHGELGREHRDLVIGGGGEHYRGFTWRQEFLQAGRSSRVNMDNWLDMRLLHPMNTQIFASDPTPEVRDDFRERMAQRAEPYSGEPNTTQLDVMYAYKVTGHFGAYLSADGAFLRSRLPFYFRPIFGAAFSTNHRHRDNHRLMRHMINRLDPTLAAVRTATGGPAQPWRLSNLHRFAPYYVDIARRAVAKLSYRATGHAVFSRRTQPMPGVTRARSALVRKLRAEGVLDPARMRSTQLYKPAALEAWLDLAEQPAFAEDELLGRLVTVELALRAVDASVDAA
jgi:asparagine synthase (glutamine-hydrolysing)